MRVSKSKAEIIFEKYNNGFSFGYNSMCFFNETRGVDYRIIEEIELQKITHGCYKKSIIYLFDDNSYLSVRFFTDYPFGMGDPARICKAVFGVYEIDLEGNKVILNENTRIN